MNIRDLPKSKKNDYSISFYNKEGQRVYFLLYVQSPLYACYKVRFDYRIGFYKINVFNRRSRAFIASFYADTQIF